MRARLLVAVVLGVAVLVGSATPAAAHGGAGSVGASNYLTELTGVEPSVKDVRVRVLDLGDRLELTSDGEDVIVLGYEDEPYLKVGPDGVFENELSSATYVNADRQASADIPDEVDADAPPRWRQISDGSTARWHDHRAHWMGSQDPPAVDADRSRPHVILERWEVPLEIDGRRSVIVGTLTWTPGPPVATWLLVAGAAGAIAMAAFVILRRRRPVVLAAVVAVMVLVGVGQTIGLAFAPNQAGPAAVRLAATAIYPVMGWVAGIVGVRFLLRGRPDGIYIAAMAGAVALLVGGLQDVSTLARAHTPFLWGATMARWAVALSMGGGSAILGMCLALRPRQAMLHGVIR